MEQDATVFFFIIGVVILLFVLIAMIFRMQQRRRTSRWGELAALFPSPDTAPELNIYKHCSGQVGRFSFTRKDGWGFGIGFSPDGIRIKVKSKKYQDLLVPWEKVRSASKYSLGSRVAAKVEIDSEIPLSFYLSGEALSAFETWHSVDVKSLQQFIEER